MEPVRRSGLKILATGNAVAQGAALIRYTILARLLGPEQLGLAAILILTSQFFDQVTDAGLDRFLIQSKAGNSRSANSTVHLLLLMRGVTLATAIILSSGLLAHFFHHQELRSGLMLLALSPLIFGLSHFDFRRVQRHHRFAPEGSITIVAESVGLIATIIAAIVTRSFIAIAIALIARSAANVIVSHLVARRPYRMAFAKAHWKAISAFGFPLMLNGILLYLSGQGDRLFIGNQIGTKELGHYSAVILLIFYPATMVVRFVQSINLPMIAGLRDRPIERLALIDRNAGEAILLAIAMALGFALLAPVAVPLLYGKAFALPALLIAMIGALQATRSVRLWPTTVALATGNSSILLWNSIARLSAFPLALVLRPYFDGLWCVVVAFIVGEFVAFAVSLVQLHRLGLGQRARDWNRIGLLAAAIVAMAILIHGIMQHWVIWMAGGGALLGATLATIALTERVALAELWAMGRRQVLRRR